MPSDNLEPLTPDDFRLLMAYLDLIADATCHYGFRDRLDAIRRGELDPQPEEPTDD